MIRLLKKKNAVTNAHGLAPLTIFSFVLASMANWPQARSGKQTSSLRKTCRDVGSADESTLKLH